MQPVLRPDIVEVYAELQSWVLPGSLSPNFGDKTFSDWHEGLRAVRARLVEPSRQGKIMTNTQKIFRGDVTAVAGPVPSSGSNTLTPKSVAAATVPELPPIAEGEVISPQESNPDNLALPNFRPTKRAIMRCMLVDDMSRWNTRVEPGSCCPWHAALHELHDILRELLALRCKPGFKPLNGWQCSTCGVLNDPAEDDTRINDPFFQMECDTCGFIGRPCLPVSSQGKNQSAADLDQSTVSSTEQTRVDKRSSPAVANGRLAL
eukprot:gnl/TRDRNA2_/TRDRNA2_114095_c1_seq1.p1 gnl/TRDRNA2_/TRDRNA2_114095_c1~~gnl/TRDRNA2_/TRDRNA2_114095_c1_seq1.p1  ORF type:complete len:305 (-),score=29.69 gnl/TRDRNA2_/TRDRNA2_114095_c1_seq1:192-977(-)